MSKKEEAAKKEEAPKDPYKIMKELLTKGEKEKAAEKAPKK